MSQVHIVLSTYNGEQFLSEQLDSILNGTHQNFTIEVSDDCSTDRTVSIVKQYIEKYPQKISLHVNEKNLGYTMNFLEGLKRSQAPYVMFCDQDDIWMPEKIEHTLAHMNKIEKNHENEPVLVYSDAMMFDSKSGDEMGLFHKNSHLSTEKVDISHLLIENKCIGCTVMLNQRVRDYLVQLPEGIRVHDWWLALICSSFGQIGYLDEPTLYYRQHSKNMIGGTSFVQYLIGRIRSLKDQRETVCQCCCQGKAFYELFSDQLTKEQENVFQAFISLFDVNWLARRIRCIRYGFWKSGVSRNIGLLIIL